MIEVEVKEPWQRQIDSMSWEDLLTIWWGKRHPLKQGKRTNYFAKVMEHKKYNAPDAPRSNEERKEIMDRVRNSMRRR